MRLHWTLLFACSAALAAATPTSTLNATMTNTTHGALVNATASNATMTNSSAVTTNNASANAAGTPAHANTTHPTHCPPHEEPSKFEGESYLITGLGLGLHIHNKTGHVCKSRNNGRFDAWHIERKGCTGNKYVFRSEFGYLGLETKSKPEPGSGESVDSEPSPRCHLAVNDRTPFHSRVHTGAQAQAPHEEEHDVNDKKKEKDAHHNKKKTNSPIEYKLIGNATEPVEWSVFVLLPDKRILLSHKKMVLTFDSRCLALTHDFAAAKLLKIQNLKASEDEDE